MAFKKKDSVCVFIQNNSSNLLIASVPSHSHTLDYSFGNFIKEPDKSNL